MRLWLWLLALFGGTAVAAPVEFDIPRQAADSALSQFARQSGLPVLFPYDLVRSHRANALRGRYEPDDGLRRLLAGTGLIATAEGNGQISVRVATNPPRLPVAAGAVSALEPDENAFDDGELSEITVTGSRIERDGMTTPTPVTAIFSGELQSIGPGALADALVQLPQFVNNDTLQTQSFATAGAAGASFMNLRGIGSSRTLVLLDGRRVVPTTRLGAVDIALLPRTLVSRVEVVTGGASAAYGSDAVSGVVNILLDRDTDGLELRAQTGMTELEDGTSGELVATWARRFGDRSRLLLSAELSRADGIRGYGKRDWFGGWATIANPTPGGPAQVTVPDTRSTAYTYGGVITSSPLAGTQFLAGGVPAPFVAGAYRSGTTQSGGSGEDPGRDYVWIMPSQTRSNAFLKYETGWDGGAQAFVQLLASRAKNEFEKDASSQWGVWDMTIFADNADVGSFRMGRVSVTDLGSGRVTNRSELLSATIGGERPLPHAWTIAGYYQYGVNHAELIYRDTVRLDRIYRQFDSVVDAATGKIVCRSTLTFPDDGCIAANPFGPGSISPAAAAWAKEGRSEQDQQLEQQVAEITLQGQPLIAPAGPVSVAFGAVWRHESVDNQALRFPAELNGLIVTPASEAGYRGLPANYSGQANIFERTAATALSGGYAVREIFGEGVLPVASALPFARHVDLNAAVRYAHYEGSGPVTAWKAGVDWQLFDDLRLRATRSRDIRAGSLSERFDFSGVGSVVIDRFQQNSPTYAIIAIRGGNPEVGPEKADTLTFGAIYQPRWLQGAALSADYFDIKIHDAIATLGVQVVMDRCFAGDEPLCARITRNAVSNQVVTINNAFLNIAQARSRGIDAELAYRGRLALFGGDERIAFRLFGNRALESSTTNFNEPKVDRLGQTGLTGGMPRWQVNASLAYERGAFQATLQERVISRGSYVSSFGPQDIDDNHVGGAAYTNLRVSWRFGEDAQATLWFLNVHNLFDRAPPLAPDWGFFGSFHTNEGLFDVLGRRYTLGVRLRR